MADKVFSEPYQTWLTDEPLKGWLTFSLAICLVPGSLGVAVVISNSPGATVGTLILNALEMFASMVGLMSLFWIYGCLAVRLEHKWQRSMLGLAFPLALLLNAWIFAGWDGVAESLMKQAAFLAICYPVTIVVLYFRKTKQGSGIF